MNQKPMSSEEVVKMLRRDPEYEDLVRDCYWGKDRLEAGERFLNSGEFREVQRLLNDRHRNGVVLDLGSGTGIAAYAFAQAGTRLVYALEPDPSVVVGRGAIAGLTFGLPVTTLDGFGESIPLQDKSVDVVFARAVLHHASDLPGLVEECARVLKPGGLFLATREHVANTAKELQTFWAMHPLHHLTQNEYAFTLDEYIHSLVVSKLQPLQVLGPWESVINAFPAVKSSEELENLPKKMLIKKLGTIGGFAGSMALTRNLILRYLTSRSPGKPYCFLAQKSSCRDEANYQSLASDGDTLQHGPPEVSQFDP